MSKSMTEPISKPTLSTMTLQINCQLHSQNHIKQDKLSRTRTSTLDENICIFITIQIYLGLLSLKGLIHKKQYKYM